MKETEKRIESKTSRTAEINCMIRAGSFYEKRIQYKSNDYIAPKLIPKYLIPIIRVNILKNFFLNRFFPQGIYEYVISRTKIIDSIFKNALITEFDQILIFGAGFDSRGIRFADLNKKTKIFELDSPITQKAKIDQLKKRGVKINSNINFISINFNKESVKEKLLEYGFEKDQKSLFILEGLIFYLDKQAVDNTFNVINKLAGNKSEVVFDYIYSSVLRGEKLYYGESEILNGVTKRGEPWSFGIEKGEIESFLKDKNLSLIQSLDPEDLEKEFFQDENGNIIAKVNGTHAIAYARKDM